MNNLEIKGRFKCYPHLVVGIDRNIYQLAHFHINREIPFRKLKYYKERDAYGYNGSYISKSKLLNLFYKDKCIVNQRESKNVFN